MTDSTKTQPAVAISNGGADLACAADPAVATA